MEERAVKPPSKRQLEALAFIESFISSNGYAPTVREIAQGLRLKSSSTVFRFMQRLEECGLIKTDSKSPRALIVVGYQRDNEILRNENAKLRAENAKLKQRLSKKEAMANG